MSPSLRVVAATFIIVVAAYYYQINALERAEQSLKPVVPFTGVIAETRTRIARSPHPELYAPGERFGFMVYGANIPTNPASFYAFQYAFVPAMLSRDADADRVVVVTFPEEVANFEANNRVRLLDTFGAGVHVYQRERK